MKISGMFEVNLNPLAVLSEGENGINLSRMYLEAFNEV